MLLATRCPQLVLRAITACTISWAMMRSLYMGALPPLGRLGGVKSDMSTCSFRFEPLPVPPTDETTCAATPPAPSEKVVNSIAMAAPSPFSPKYCCMRRSLCSSQPPFSPSSTASWFTSPTTLASRCAKTRSPLKMVCCPIRSISAMRWSTSACRARRSEAELVGLAACTASSRMRCRFSVTVPIAPSVVCNIEMPSLALRVA